MYSWFSRLSTARGSCPGLVTVGPANNKACKFVPFTEGLPEGIPTLSMYNGEYPVPDCSL